MKRLILLLLLFLIIIMAILGSISFSNVRQINIMYSLCEMETTESISAVGGDVVAFIQGHMP